MFAFDFHCPFKWSFSLKAAIKTYVNPKQEGLLFILIKKLKLLCQMQKRYKYLFSAWHKTKQTKIADPLAWSRCEKKTWRVWGWTITYTCIWFSIFLLEFFQKICPNKSDTICRISRQDPVWIIEEVFVLKLKHDFFCQMNRAVSFQEKFSRKLKTSWEIMINLWRIYGEIIWGIENIFSIVYEKLDDCWLCPCNSSVLVHKTL